LSCRPAGRRGAKAISGFRATEPFGAEPRAGRHVRRGGRSAADHERRLAAVREILAGELAARDVYDVVDPGKIQAEIDATRERQYLHACNGCEIGFAREIGADRVLTGHVRKVSSLIMALWVDIKDAETGRPVVRKVLDFRGDNDRAWQRAALYLVRELEQLPPEAR
jgi:Protein of unknown function (DUF2380)